MSHDSVTLSWQAPAGAAVTGYQILRRDPASQDAGVFDTVEADTGSADTSYVDSTVQPLTRYVYRVKAHSSSGTSGVSNYVNATTLAAPPPADVPAAPANLTAPEVSSGSVTLSWDAPAGGTVTGYEILRRDPASQDAGVFDTVEADTGSADTSYVDSVVQPLTRYVYRVKAHSSSGTSAVSNYVNVTTPAHTPDNNNDGDDDGTGDDNNDGTGDDDGDGTGDNDGDGPDPNDGDDDSVVFIDEEPLQAAQQSARPDRPVIRISTKPHCQSVGVGWDRPGVTGYPPLDNRPNTDSSTNLDTLPIGASQLRYRDSDVTSWTTQDAVDTAFGAPSGFATRISPLTNNTQYDFQLRLSSRTTAESTSSTWSSWSQTKTDSPAEFPYPDKARNVMLSFDATDNEIDVTWDSPNTTCYDSPTTYKIKVSWTGYDHEYFSYSTSIDAPATTYSIGEANNCPAWDDLDEQEKDGWSVNGPPRRCYYESRLLQVQQTYRAYRGVDLSASDPRIFEGYYNVNLFYVKVTPATSDYPGGSPNIFRVGPEEIAIPEVCPIDNIASYNGGTDSACD